MKEGDKILEINGKSINTTDEITNYRNKNLKVKDSSDLKIKFKIKRGKKIIEKEITPEIISKSVHTDTFNLNYFDSDDASGKHVKFIDNYVDIDIKNSLVTHKVDYGNDGLKTL